MDILSVLFNSLENKNVLHSRLMSCFRTGRVLNSEQLYVSVASRVNKLKLIGCKEGRVVITTFVNDDFEFVITELAILHLKAIHFPVCFNDLRSGARNILEQVSPAAIISNSRLVIRWLANESQSKFKNVFTGINLVHLSGESISSSLPVPDIPVKNDLISDKGLPSCLLLTSGTISDQKIVALTDENLSTSYAAFSNVDLIQSAQSYLSILPLYFSGGRKVLYSCLLAGKNISFYNHNDHISKALVETGADLTAGTPYILKKLLAEKPRLSTEIKFICGGAYLDSELIKKAHEAGISVFNVYGLTETSSILTYNTLAANQPASVGKVSHLNQVSISEQGEILVKGSNVFLGYVTNHSLVSPHDENNWFRTGDTGRFDEDGFLYLTGRTNDLVKLSNGVSVNISTIGEEVRQYLYNCDCRILIRSNDELALVISPIISSGKSPDSLREEAILAVKLYNKTAPIPISEFYIDTNQRYFRDDIKESKRSLTLKYRNVLFSRLTSVYDRDL